MQEKKKQNTFKTQGTETLTGKKKNIERNELTITNHMRKT